MGVVSYIEGNDKTANYLSGAYKALKMLQEYNVDVVLLKANSPSCGSNYIYDGTFSHTLVSGDGIAAALFKKHGILVYNENELDKFFKYLEMR